MTECDLKPSVTPGSNMMESAEKHDEIDNNNKPDKTVVSIAPEKTSQSANDKSKSSENITSEMPKVPVSEPCTTQPLTNPSNCVTVSATNSSNNVTVNEPSLTTSNVSSVNATIPSNSVSVQTSVKDLTIPTPNSGKILESDLSSKKSESLSKGNKQESQSPRKLQSNKPVTLEKSPAGKVKSVSNTSTVKSVPRELIVSSSSTTSTSLKASQNANRVSAPMSISTIPSAITLPSSGLPSHVLGKAPLQSSAPVSTVQLASQFVDKSVSTTAPQYVLGGTTTVATANGELINMPTEFLHNGNHMIITRSGHSVSPLEASIGNVSGATHQIIVQDEANNVISIPEYSFPTMTSLTPGSLSSLKLENGSNKLQLAPGALSPLIAGCSSSVGGITLHGNVISIPEPPAPTQLPTAPHPIKIEPTNGMTARPPNTELLLKTAKSMLKLNDDPIDQYKRVFPGSILEVDEAGTILSSTTAQDSEDLAIHENVQEMEVDENGTYILESVEGAESLYAEDPNIMWIEETVEVEQEAMDGMSNNMVIILNPNGTVNEELMLAHGLSLDTVKAFAEANTATEEVSAVTTVPNISTPLQTTSLQTPTLKTTTTTHTATSSASVSLQTSGGPAGVGLPSSVVTSPSVGLPTSGLTSITSLQHPIPKKLLAGIEPIMNAALPSGVLQSVSHVVPKSENPRSVILDPKEDCMLLNDVKDPLLTQPGVTVHHGESVAGGDTLHVPGGDSLHGKIITINGQHHLITTSKPIPNLRRISGTQNIVTPLGTLDLRLPKKDEMLGQYVSPTALVPEQTVLKVLDQSQLLKGKQDDGLGPPKVKRQRLKDENGNGTFINRKTTSLGALGQALHGIPRDSRENAVQICPICKFQATTKNPYRHLQDHLARVHFKERIAAELPTKKPYICPFQGCDGKQYPDWQAVMRHYIGKKHGILDKYVREQIAETGIKLPEQYVRSGMELSL